MFGKRHLKETFLSISALVERQEQVYETCIAISIDKHRIARHTGGNATHVLRARDERGIAARG